MNDEVLISGAGPAGLAAALALAEAGFRVRVFEQGPALHTDARATTFHPPTLDMMDRFGVGQKMAARGVQCPHWQIRWHPSGERAVFDVTVLENDTRHPYRLQCEQTELTRFQLEALSAMPNARVEFGAKVTGATQDHAGVSVTIERGGEPADKAASPSQAASIQTIQYSGDLNSNRASHDAAPGGKTETVRGAWLIGTDGSHSAVRHALGLEFTGSVYPETNLIATVRFPFEQHLEGLSGVNYCWREGTNFSLLKVDDTWRVAIYPLLDRTIEEQLTPESIEAALQHIVPQPRPFEVLALRAYRAHQRMVAKYRVGRIFLAGDAAHLTSPTGGMGLNGGVHDAINLAEKLTAVVKKGEPDELLDRYERQRKPVVAEAIIAQSDANRARMRELDPAKRRASLKHLQDICADRGKLHEHMLKTSMIAGLRQAAAVA